MEYQGEQQPPSNEACTNSTYSPNGPVNPVFDALQPRDFQCEMLEESLRSNIIVAMDTGSGKTLIAVLRMQVELERTSPEKLIWFLAPHVELATQQAKVIAAQIPSVQTRLLLGADGVDHWSEQWIWDEILHGIRIVVSTHQVLLDALIHGFVQMARLSLMIFDEAHHCVADHPASRILRDFYHPRRAMSKDQVPSILGLTASPVVNSRVGKLEELETNLQAISRTPRLHREELLRFVYQPSLIKLAYAAPELEVGKSEMVYRLNMLRMSLDIEQDPYIKLLRSELQNDDSQQLKKALSSRKTYCQEQLKRLNTRAMILEDELGPWATEWYLNTCIQKLQRLVNNESTSFRFLDDTEKVYLEQCLRTLTSCIPTETLLAIDSTRVTPKFLRLTDFLISQQRPGFAGLLFVKTRAEVAVLSQMLSMHPDVRKFYTISTFVGASSFAKRRDIGELVEMRGQIDTLDDLRYGRKNLVVTTSALEEGIDVSACNTVVCFDKPSNLKSFIQRRGRARKSESTFALLLAEDDSSSTFATWRELEEKMQKQYMDDMRQLKELELLEETEEGEREFSVESTGAKLMLSDAVRHLYHFCATLLSQSSNPAPIFTFTDASGDHGQQAVTAKVILPICVDASVREARSRFAWRTEKSAKRDAAFEAYIQLYHAGLISDNLLPIRGFDEASAEFDTKVDKIASLVQVPGQLNPWNLVAVQWQTVRALSDLQFFEVSLHCGEEIEVTMLMLSSAPLPPIPAITLFWDARTTFTVTVQPSSGPSSQLAFLESAVQSTALLLSSVFRSRMAAANTDFIALFIPTGEHDPIQWAHENSGTVEGDSLKQTNTPFRPTYEYGIIHDMNDNGAPNILRGFQRISAESEEGIETGEAALLFQVTRFPKRTDFLHAVSEQNQGARAEPHSTLLRPEDCKMDRLPLLYALFAATVPATLHRIGVRLVAAHLSSTLLAPVGLIDTELLVTAITTSAAREVTNYQRQEFLGDSVLKFLTSLMLKSKHLHWHEGILSLAKDHIVSNASLAKAALAIGLDRFILTTPFTGSKWKPPYVSDNLGSATGKPRQLSTKTLADVVEALIGAAFLEGGFDKATAILQILLPKASWCPVGESNNVLHSAHIASILYPPHFSQLEHLIGYTFTLKSLPLEALTHASYIGSNVSTSYDRLEFLGDVCLDIIIATMSFNHEPAIITHSLHLIRTAVVNAHFLAFLCLSLTTSISRKIIQTGNKDNDVSLSETTVPIHIWSFMRHAASTVRQTQQDCLKRYEALKATILESLRQGSRIPWALLARLDAPKFFSDIIESLIGAIYIDSHGSLAACEAFLERLGVMGYLRRLLQGGVALYHPKEQLGQLVDTETVRYEVFREEGEDKGLGCLVWVGDREVARVGDGVSVLEVETKAAEEAVRVLEGEGARLGKKKKKEEKGDGECVAQVEGK